MFKLTRTRNLIVALALSAFLTVSATAGVLQIPQQETNLSTNEVINRINVLEGMLLDILAALEELSKDDPIAVKDSTGADLRNGKLHVKDIHGGEHTYACIGGQWVLINDVWSCPDGTIVEI